MASRPFTLPPPKFFPTHPGLGTFAFFSIKPVMEMGAGAVGGGAYAARAKGLFPDRLEGPQPLCWHDDRARRGCLFLLICGFLSWSQEAKRCWWEALIIGTFGMNLDPKGQDGLSALMEFLEQDTCQGSVALRLNTPAVQCCNSQLGSGTNYNQSLKQLTRTFLPPSPHEHLGLSGKGGGNIERSVWLPIISKEAPVFIEQELMG